MKIPRFFQPSSTGCNRLMLEEGFSLEELSVYHAGVLSSQRPLLLSTKRSPHARRLCSAPHLSGAVLAD